MDDWDNHLPQVMGTTTLKSTSPKVMGTRTLMMLTGHEKVLSLTFFYFEYEGRKTAPQIYVRDVIKKQQKQSKHTSGTDKEKEDIRQKDS